MPFKGLKTKIISRKKKPEQLVASTNRKIKILKEEVKKENSTRDIQKACQKITANLYQMRLILFGNGITPPKPGQIEVLAPALFEQDILLPMLESIRLFEFEAQKDVVLIYRFVLQKKTKLAEKYVNQNPIILSELVDGYPEARIAYKYGQILREAIHIRSIHEMLLQRTDLFMKFFDYVQLPIFDVASDAFSTLKLMLTHHKTLCAKFMQQKFDAIFAGYNKLLQCNNYATKRQALSLLCPLLRERENYLVMMKYINMGPNIITIMNLLQEKKKCIQYDAFHVFAIFVANPEKSIPVATILYKNKEALIEFIQKFQKEDGGHFEAEKETILEGLKKLECPASLM